MELLYVFSGPMAVIRGRVDDDIGIIIIIFYISSLSFSTKHAMYLNRKIQKIRMFFFLNINFKMRHQLIIKWGTNHLKKFSFYFH